MCSSHTLGLIPYKSTIFQQCPCNLGLLNVVSQLHQLEVCVKLMGEPTHPHPINCTLKVVWKMRLNGYRKALNDRLTI